MAGDDDEPVRPKEEQPQAAAVTLKLPPFWPADPELWMAQVEAQFRTRNITQDNTKYDYIVASLSPDTAGEIRDILLHPPENGKYEAIKQALLKQNVLSDQKRLQELLSKEDLGDRKPTQILRRINQLVGETVFDDKILKALFIQKLPPAVQGILMSSDDKTELSVLAEMADKIMEVTSPQINKLSVDNVRDSEVAALRGEINELKRMVQQMSLNKGNRKRSNSRGCSPFRRKRDPSKHPMCWYHHKFGENSTKCEQPCNWENSGNGASNKFH